MERKNITTSLEIKLVKRLKHLAVDMDKPFNDLLEQAIKDFLKKHEKPEK